jgi:hypothetical protein
MISSKTASVMLALLFVIPAGMSSLGVTQDKFSSGGSSASIEFPQAGGSDSSVSVDLPRNITVSDAYIEMEGQKKSYTSASGLIDFANPGASVAFDGSLASAPPAGKPAAYETNNITMDNGLQRSDDRRTMAKARVSFPCHLFEFDMSEVELSNFNFMWEGMSNLYDDSGSPSSAAAVYLYNCATGAWDRFQNYSINGSSNSDYVLWASVSSSPEKYVDGRGLLNALVVDDQTPPKSFTADIQTDYVALWYNGTLTSWPRNLRLDINGDGSWEWQKYGQLRGVANFTGAKFVDAIQAALDASTKDPVRIPLKFSSDRGGVLALSNLSIGYTVNNAAPTINGTIPRLEMNEDTNATELADLRDFFKDDGGVEALVFSIVYEEDAARLRAAINPDGHHVDFYTMTNNWYGDLRFRARAADPQSLYTDVQFTVRVLSVDDPPKMKSAGIMVAYQDKHYEHEFSATDVDVNDTLTFSTNSSYLTMDAETGVASFTPVNSQVGTHLFNVTVTDIAGASDTRNFTLKVENSNDPPSLEPVPDQTAIEDEPFFLQLNATDPDLDVGLDELVFEDNTPLFAISRNGTISFTPSNKDVGERHIKVSVHDIGGLKAWANFTLTVLNTNDPPRIEPAKNVTVDEDAEALFRVVASDEDSGDVLAFSVNTTMVKINSTGWVKFTPAQKDVGVHPVTVTVTDTSGASASVRFNITVANVNDAPRDVRISRPVNGTAFKQGEQVTFEGNATDDDGDALTFSWYSGTEIWGTGASFGTKLLAPGSYTVTLTVSDGNASVSSPPVGIVIQKKQAAASQGFIPGFGWAILAAALATGAVVMGKKRL